jgi:flagellar biosynthesis GTPase FlhF
MFLCEKKSKKKKKVVEIDPFVSCLFLQQRTDSSNSLLINNSPIKERGGLNFFMVFFFLVRYFPRKFFSTSFFFLSFWPCVLAWQCSPGKKKNQQRNSPSSKTKMPPKRKTPTKTEDTAKVEEEAKAEEVREETERRELKEPRQKSKKARISKKKEDSVEDAEERVEEATKFVEPMEADIDMQDDIPAVKDPFKEEHFKGMLSAEIIQYFMDTTPPSMHARA